MQFYASISRDLNQQPLREATTPTMDHPNALPSKPQWHPQKWHLCWHKMLECALSLSLCTVETCFKIYITKAVKIAINVSDAIINGCSNVFTASKCGIRPKTASYPRLRCVLFVEVTVTEQVERLSVILIDCDFEGLAIFLFRKSQKYQACAISEGSDSLWHLTPYYNGFFDA